MGHRRSDDYRGLIVASRTGVPQVLDRRAGRVASRVVLLFVALFVVFVGAAASPSQANAQNVVVESQPGDGDSLETSPERIVITFQDAVGSANQVSVSCNSNPENAISQPVVSNDNRTLTVSVFDPLPQGTCNVAWRVSQVDGEPGATGDFTFDVQSSAPGTTAPSTATTTDASTPEAEADDGDGSGSGDASGDTQSGASVDDVGEVGTDSSASLWLGRVMSILGMSVVLGGLVLIAFAWPEGPEYVIAVRFLRSAWIVGVVGTVIYVVAATSSATGASFGSSWNPVDWGDLVDAGWPGRAALARLLLVVAIGWVVALPERVVEPSTQLPALAIPVLAVATVGLTRTGGDLAALGVGMGVIHAVAMAIWLGGAIFVARIVLAGSGEEDLVHATRGFTRLAMPALGITVLTGLVQLMRLDGGGLFTTSHGRVLLLKTLAVAALLFIAVSVQQLVHARLGRARSLDESMAYRLRRAFGVDAAIGILVIALTGWMLAYPPDKIEAEATEPAPVEERLTDPEANLDIVVSLDPGRVGPNELKVRVFQPQSDLENLDVTFVPPSGSDAAEISQTVAPPLGGEGVAILAAGDSLPFPEAGIWTVRVNAITADGTVQGLTGSFTIDDAAGTAEPPSSDEPTTSTPGS